METVKNEKLVGPNIKPLHVLMVVVLVAIVLVVVYFVVNSSAQVVAGGDTINMSYTGSFTNGTVFDSNVGKQPLQFTVGAGQMIKGVDQGVIGMKLDENRTITVPVNEAYGPVNPALFAQVPSNTFKNGTPSVGMIVGTVINGQQVQGIVTAVNATTVTADFNPPLAGKTLVFDIKILSIQKK